MVGIVVVSHSKSLAEGVVELALEMVNEDFPVVAVGGLEDGSIGTDSIRILSGIEEVNRGEGVIILGDLGSSILSSQVAIDLVEDEGLRSSIRIANAPLVEGAIVAVLQASIGDTLEDVLAMAQEASQMNKV